jgi:7-carboxy-7-deazaguanine synthase
VSEGPVRGFPRPRFHIARCGKERRFFARFANPPIRRFHAAGETPRLSGVSATLVVNEVYLSLQGESTFAGLPCVFVRLTACNLRCSYCDTAYAFTQGTKLAAHEVRAKIDALAAPFASGFRDQASGISSHGTTKLPLIEFTGGEPLLQANALPLMAQLCDDGFTVLVETSGAIDISKTDPRVRRIMDLKCPSSGESARMHAPNIGHLQPTDEVKFVIGTVEDYEWAKAQIAQHGLAAKCPLLFSWVAPLLPHQQDKSLKPFPQDHTPISRKDLVERIVADALPVRFQLQMHKFIWPPDQKGV